MAQLKNNTTIGGNIFTVGSSAYFITTGELGIGTSTVSGARYAVFGGNIRIGSTGTGLVFPDGSFQTSAYPGGSNLVTTFSAGTTGLTPSNATSGAITLGGTLNVANGGTGLTTGTSGGVLYYSAAGTIASSAALAASALVVGGGAGAAPSTITTGTGVVTALGVNTGTAGAFVVNGGALGTPTSGTLTNCTFPTLNQNTTGYAAGIAGGALGQLHYQTAANTTGFVGVGTAGYVLTGAGAALPQWTQATNSNTASTIVQRDASGNFSAGTITATLSGSATSAGTATTATTATNIASGTTGQIPYQSGAGTTAFIGVGTSGYVLTGAGAALPQWTQTTNANTASTIVQRDASGNFSAGTITATLSGSATSAGTATTANTATNIAGGSAGAIHYQSGAGTTAFVGVGTSGWFLTGAGAALPQWTQVVPVANGGTGLSTGTSGGVLYYSASGTLASSAALAASALVVGGGAGVAPSTVTTGTGVVTALGVNTGTAGAFVVNGGALGTPTSGTLTNCTFPTLNQNTTGYAAGIAGGALGQLPYQTAANTTGFVGVGTSGWVLTGAGSALPQWTQATNANTASTIVQRDTSGNFSAGNITSTSFIPSGATVPTNGMYLPTANTLGFATASSQAMQIDQYNNVSINTTTVGYAAPSRTSLTVNGTGESLLALLTGGSSRGYLYANGSTSIDLAAQSGFLAMKTLTAQPLVFSVNNTTEAMRITSTGLVGIGTSAITNKLAVFGGNIQIDTGSNNYGILFSDGTYQRTAATSTSPGGSTGAIQYRSAGGAFAGNETVFYFDSATNRVGIGTNSVSASTLSVKGDAPTWLNTTNSGAPELIIGTSTTTGLVIGQTSGATYGYIKSASSEANPIIAFTSTGVGIKNVTAPINALDIAGGVVIGGGIAYAGSATAPSNGMLVQGTVGIGTSSTTGIPASNALAVFSSMYITGGVYSNSLLRAGGGLSVTSGGATIVGASTVTGSLSITGNLTVTGNINTVSSNVLVVNDPIIYIGESNPANIWDLGILGSYTSGTYKHTGMVRNQSDGVWTFFDNLVTEPSSTVNWSQPGLTFANTKMGNVNIAGSTASGSSTTGALVVAGGVGVSGDMNIGGNYTGTWNGTTISVAKGGTGLTSGTSGGVLYYSAAGTLASSAALAASALVVGGGAGGAPSTVTTGTGVVTALGVNTGTAGAFVVNGGALGTPTSGTLTNCTFPTLNQNTTGYAAGIAGGALGQLHYQTGANATGFVGVGTSGWVLTGAGSALPQWTQATNANTASTIVQRDASGNFSAGTITATNVSVSGSITTTGTSGNITGVNNLSTVTVTATGNITGTAFIPTGSTIPANGMYLPSANTVGWATNSTFRMEIDNTGNVGIGTSVPDARLDVVGGNIHIHTSTYGLVFPDNTFQTTAFSSTAAVTSFSAGTTGLTPNTGTSGSVTLAGTLAAANGGTGQSSYAVGDLLYASTTTALSKLADVATGNSLISGGVGVAPSWGKIGLTTHVSGTLPIANGGTNSTATPTNGGVSYGTSSAYAFTSAGTQNQALISNGAAAPSWVTLDLTYLPDAAFKKSVKVATTANITLSGTQTIDGIAVVATDRVLVKDQTAAAQNGIYVVAAGAWSRATDADTISEIAGGTVNVDQGATWGSVLFSNNLKTTDTLGTTAMNWSFLINNNSTQTMTAKTLSTNCTWNGNAIGVGYGGTGLTSGTSGGVLYFSAAGTIASSAALAASALVVGGGAGGAPSTVTTGTGVVTALGVNTGTAGAFVVNGGALGTPTSGTLTNCTFPTLNQNTTGYAAGIAGGALGQLHYQTAANTTGFVGVGTSGWVLTGAGSALPQWTQATNANTASTIVQRDASGNFSAGTITASLTGTASTATNIAGGALGQIHYQTGAGATGFVGVGTSGWVLTGAGSALPQWTQATNANTASTIVQRDASGNFSAGTITATLSGSATSAGTATTATNLASGTAGAIPYQTGAGATSFISAGASGTVLTGTGGTPAYSASPTISTSITTPIHYGGTAAGSTLTLQSTSGAGTSDSIIFKVGNAGATTAMTVNTSGNVGIGTTVPAYKLEVSGSFAATTKSFLINHPTKSGKKLRYGSLEGPENGVYIRGRTKDHVIELPDYWVKLVDPDSITVNITPIGTPKSIAVKKIENNCVYLNSGRSKTIDCYFTIFAERIDVEKLQVEI